MKHIFHVFQISAVRTSVCAKIDATPGDIAPLKLPFFPNASNGIISLPSSLTRTQTESNFQRENCVSDKK